MTTQGPAAPVRCAHPALGVPPVLSVLLVLVGSLLLGAATSWAQGVLPDAFRSFANSASGWTICTALLVAAVRPSLAWGALSGAVSFVALVLGYTEASHLHGLTYDPSMWVVVGLVAGPFVGAASAAVAGAGSRTIGALGGGVLGGVLVGDGIYGLTIIGDTTSPVYWSTVLVLGVGLALTVALTRLRAVVPVTLELVTGAVTAIALLLVLSAL